MIEIKEIKGIKITPPKWWVALLMVIVMYCLWTGDIDTIIELIKKFK